MERKRNVLEELAASDVPRDPLISPMYATDEMLRQLPPTFLIVSFLILPSHNISSHLLHQNIEHKYNRIL